MPTRSHALACTLAVAVLALPVFGQHVEKGSREDLAKTATLFVDGPADPETRRKLLKALAKELPQLRVVESEGEAELVLRFSMTAPSDRPRNVARPDSNADPEPTVDHAAGRPRFSARRGGSLPPDFTTPGRMLHPDPSPGARAADEAVWVETSPVTMYASGEVLRRTGDGAYRRAFDFVRPVDGRTRLVVAEDFVRAFAKQYRKANPAPRST